MIREVTCQTAIDYEHLPDGGKAPVLDAYDGCQLRCPYCFQWQDPTWNKDILVKVDLPEVLAKELKTWDHSQALHVGSRSDPYMPLEETYGLTRRTLHVLMTHNLPCFVSTKSDASALRRDVDLFQEYGEKLTVCMGLSNVEQLWHAGDQQHRLPNILTVHRLVEMGIKTWASLTPSSQESLM